MEARGRLRLVEGLAVDGLERDFDLEVDAEAEGVVVEDDVLILTFDPIFAFFSRFWSAVKLATSSRPSPHHSYCPSPLPPSVTGMLALRTSSHDGSLSASANLRPISFSCSSVRS